MKHHDEEKDLRSLKKVAFINFVEKTITVSKSSLGIKRLGMLDFLIKKGWRILNADNKVVTTYKGSDEDKQSVRQIKKEKKASKLTDKTKTKKK